MSYSQEDCTEALRTAAEQFGEDLTSTQYREWGNGPSARTIINKFGSWNDAKEAAGLSTTPRGVNIDKKRTAPPTTMTDDGHIVWVVQDLGERHYVRVHRVLALMDHDVDVVGDNDVHHPNEIPWDNRRENLEIMGHKEHSEHHTPEHGVSDPEKNSQRALNRERDENGQFV